MGATLDHDVRDEPLSVPGGHGEQKWIHNYDDEFKGVIPVRQALAESRNAATTWIAGEVGIAVVLRTAQELGIKTPLGRYISTALGASEVRLVELANAYRAMASGIAAEPHGIQRVTDHAGATLFAADGDAHPLELDAVALEEIQEGLRGVVRLPGGTAHSLDSGDFPIPVMGKTGTSSGFRDALFVGSTYGMDGITVAVRVGYDDNRTLGNKETGARTALPIFREIMLEIYRRRLAGPVPRFPDAMEQRISAYVACEAERALQAANGKTAALAPLATQPGVGIANLASGRDIPSVPEIPSAMGDPTIASLCARPGLVWSRALPATAVSSH